MFGGTFTIKSRTCAVVKPAGSDAGIVRLELVVAIVT